jgi:hypothetical protein
MTKLCECGCGEEVGFLKQYPKRRKRFVHGHNGRGVSRPLDVRQSISQRMKGRQNALGHKQTDEHKQKNGEARLRGDDISYGHLHEWVNKVKKKTGKCTFCGVKPPSKFRYGTHWANIDHTYKRDLDDFIELCPACHRAYDVEKGLR